MRMAVLITLFAAVWLMGGCAPELESPALEDYATVGVIGFDYLDAERMRVVVSVPVPTQKATEKSQVFTTVSKLPSEALIELGAKSERTLVLSQLRVILFNEELARKVGLRKAMLDLYRNPSVGDNVFVAIVKDSVQEVIAGRYENKPEFNRYLNDLLHPRRETAFSSFTTLHDFMYMMTNEARDPNLPYLVKTDGELVVSKVALMKEDKMVGFLSQREGKIVQCLLGRSMPPKMVMNIQEDPQSGKKSIVVLDFIRSDSKITASGSIQAPVIRARIHLRGAILGYTGRKDLEFPDQAMAVERALEQVMKQEAEALLQKMQRMGVDPMALEEALRQKYAGDWQRKIGLAAFRKARFDIHVEVDITGYGTIK
jgi:spore germination protein